MGERNKMNKLFIGWSEADITPVTNKKIGLYGQYYVRLAEKIHSRLKVTAAAFSSGKHKNTATLSDVSTDRIICLISGNMTAASST